MLERMMEARAEEDTARREDPGIEAEDLADGDRDDALGQRILPHAAAAAEPLPAGESSPSGEDGVPVPAEMRRNFAALERLVRDFNLRDPLLAAHSVSCRLDFGDALPVTAALSGTARDIEIRFDLSAEAFALRTGCPVGLMADALRARFPDLRIRVIFARAEDESGREEDEA